MTDLGERPRIVTGAVAGSRLSSAAVRSAVGGWRTLGGVRERPEIGLIAQLGELGEEAVELGLGRALVEVILSKIPELRTVPEHVIDRGEQRCGDRAESFRRAATALEAQELRPEIAVLLVAGGHRALHQRRLEPWRRPSAISTTCVCRRSHSGIVRPIFSGRLWL